MSKMNKPMAMKKLAMSKQFSSGGCAKSGDHFLTPYEQGCQDWQNGTPLSKMWHTHRQQGWKAMRNKDIAFATQCPSARLRVEQRLGLCTG